ncbi:MAG: regulatory protein RecX [Bacteroidia bacterium]|jgi:regulatory protein
MTKYPSSLTPAQALIKAAHYCAYQERCHAEVLEKLSQWGIYGQDADLLVLNLIEQGYLNEERFAKAFAGGKFRTKQWGRLRIARELKMRQVSEYCIRQALAEIDEEDYKAGMHKLIRQKLVLIKEKNPLVKKSKTATYLIGKGYEPDQVWNVLRSMIL